MDPKINKHLVWLALVATLLLAACSPVTDQPSSTAVITQQLDTPTPMVMETETIQAAATVAFEPVSDDDLQPVPTGLVYRDEAVLWLVEADGQPRLLTDHVDAVPSPGLLHAYRWDYENTLHLIDLSTGQEKTVTPEGRLSSLFNWAGEDTILLGIWLAPDESEGPNYGHLASLDVASGELTILDLEHLMFSGPAQSPDGRTIAFSSAGPMLFTKEDGLAPFPVETYSGIENVQSYLSPAWSPDGRYLAWIIGGGPFGDDPDATMALAVYDLRAGTAATRLAFDPARWGATPPAAVWSPDGLWLALRVFANGPEGSGIWLLAADGSQEHYISGRSGNANYPVWSPDSRQLLYYDFADEDEAPYAQQLIFDLETQTSSPVALEKGLGLMWLDLAGGEETSAPDPLCSYVGRPALLLHEAGDYIITDPVSGEACPFVFPGQLPGLIQAGGDALFYHEMDFTTQSTVVRRLGPDGANAALSFTETGPPAQLLHYIVSPDGRQVAWSDSRADESGRPVSDLWLAGTDGSGQVQLLAGIPATNNRLIIPIRFSSDGQQLYYAMQPIGVGGSWVAFNGRYDSLYAIPTAGGQPLELFQCPAGSLLCLGDFSGEGEALKVAYTDSTDKAIRIVTASGQEVNQFGFPESGFLGYPAFGPGGELAFYVASIGEHADGYPIPQPGAIYLVLPPYDGQPQLVKSDDTVATLIDWFDSEYLVYNSVDPGGNWSMALTNLAGEATIWGRGPVQFITILR